MKEKCQICHEDILNRVQIPSSTGLWVCYDCFSYWVEGYEPEEVIFKIKKWWRNKVYNTP